MAGIFSNTKQGCTYIGALIDTVYTNRTGRYGMVLTSLIQSYFTLLFRFLFIHFYVHIMYILFSMIKKKKVHHISGIQVLMC